MIITSLDVDREALQARTGWEMQPEGACKGDLCVPLPAGAASGDTIDARVLSERLGMPLLHDEETGTWCLGPEALGRVLTSARAPDVTLPDLEGRPFELGSLRGQKVLLVAWASW